MGHRFVQQAVIVSPARTRRGLSLVELLCVMAIIAVLAGLLAGPVLKALAKVKDWEWSDRVPMMTNKVAEQLGRRVGHLGRETMT